MSLRVRPCFGAAWLPHEFAPYGRFDRHRQLAISRLPATGAAVSAIWFDEDTHGTTVPFAIKMPLAKPPAARWLANSQAGLETASRRAPVDISDREHE